MTQDKNILIKNIYYMLSYAFQVLQQPNFEEVESEEFENIHDLFAAILSKGIAQQLKQGLHREYIEKRDNGAVLRGKLDIHENIKNAIQHQQKLACEYDELSANNLFNQILKTTAYILLTQPTVDVLRKSELKKLLLFFSEIEIIDPRQILWSHLIFHRNNHTYRMLINVCYFVLADLLLTEEKGQHKLATFLNEHTMHRLFERFILEYYRYHHPQISAAAPQISWIVEEGSVDFLPTMQSDIVLQDHGKSLIIDTKYYQKTMQTYFDNISFHSGNLYQIFTYVKNSDIFQDGRVSGMLLYAKTDESITPNNTYTISGNRFYIRTLDLNKRFTEIRFQLDEYLSEWIRCAVDTE